MERLQTPLLSFMRQYKIHQPNERLFTIFFIALRLTLTVNIGLLRERLFPPLTHVASALVKSLSQKCNKVYSIEHF